MDAKIDYPNNLTLYYKYKYFLFYLTSQIELLK